MSGQPDQQVPSRAAENDEGVGLGISDEPNTFEPEEDPEAAAGQEDSAR